MPGNLVDKVAAAALDAINGVVPGAACEGDWLITKDGIRVSLTGMAHLVAQAAIDAILPKELKERDAEMYAEDGPDAAR